MDGNPCLAAMPAEMLADFLWLKPKPTTPDDDDGS